GSIAASRCWLRVCFGSGDPAPNRAAPLRPALVAHDRGCNYVIPLLTERLHCGTIALGHVGCPPKVIPLLTERLHCGLEVAHRQPAAAACDPAPNRAAPLRPGPGRRREARGSRDPAPNRAAPLRRRAIFQGRAGPLSDPAPNRAAPLRRGAG